ncbi:hypothetical protein CE91St42_34330 [Oscillospiraceae bacterium]|nr:hypothetical protein CE91St42_34330 [Oscillospiraceae bacterium]
MQAGAEQCRRDKGNQAFFGMLPHGRFPLYNGSKRYAAPSQMMPGMTRKDLKGLEKTGLKSKI